MDTTRTSPLLSTPPGVGESYAFAGDWHGNVPWVNKTLTQLAENDVKTVYQVGDFGLWPGREGKHYLDMVSNFLDRRDMQLYIILGNHEDYNRYEQMTLADDGWLTLPNPKYSRLHFAPRAHIWEAHGLRFASLAGAGSIDQNLRVEGKSWWPQEEITETHRDQLIALLDEKGWANTDVFLSHESPAGVTMESWAAVNNPHWFTPEIQHYCYRQRVLLREAVDRAAPRWLIHGHWHYRHTTQMEGVTPTGHDYRCNIVGLAADGDNGNLWRPRIGELQQQ